METRQFWELAGVEEVEWEGGDEVEDEPSAQVLLGDLPRARHHLPLLVHERRPEVQDDVWNIFEFESNFMQIPWAVRREIFLKALATEATTRVSAMIQRCHKREGNFPPLSGLKAQSYLKLFNAEDWKSRNQWYILSLNGAMCWGGGICR